MQGLMMDFPLTITSIMEHAERVHGAQEIVSVTCLLYTSPSPRDLARSRMPSSA